MSVRVFFVLAFLLLTDCFTARADCLFTPNLSLLDLQDRYTSTTALIDVVGDGCRDAGVGVLISRTGLVITARHVVQKRNCKESGILARFSWAPDNSIAMQIVESGLFDFAILKPVSSWSATSIPPTPPSHICTAPLSVEEAGEDESFIRFGRYDPRPTAFPYAGRVILTSKSSGRAPMQLVCSVISHGDSGGPVFSANTGALIGITTDRVDTDQNGNAVNDKGLILPLSSMLSVSKILSEASDSCDTSNIRKLSHNPSKAEVPYEVALSSSGNDKILLFSPIFGYAFEKIESVSFVFRDGKYFNLSWCDKNSAPQISDCSAVRLKERSMIVSLSKILDAIKEMGYQENQISAVKIYTLQGFGFSKDARDILLTATGLGTTLEARSDLVYRAEIGTISGGDREKILEQLEKAPDHVKSSSEASVYADAPLKQYKLDSSTPDRWLVGDKSVALGAAITELRDKYGDQGDKLVVENKQKTKEYPGSTETIYVDPERLQRGFGVWE